MKIFEKININNYRYERKFSISCMLPEQICVFIKRHPCMFYKSYPDRYINNMYFDTVDLANYWNNVDGNSQRLKLRIRWYHDLFTKIKVQL